MSFISNKGLFPLKVEYPLTREYTKKVFLVVEPLRGGGVVKPPEPFYSNTLFHQGIRRTKKEIK